ncbi:FAD binding domain-containing protein [Acidobacteriota bacterium]
MIRFDYYKPISLEKALTLKRKHPDAKYVAGGTDVMVQIKNRDICPSALISLRNISELSSIDINGSARIGAAVTIRDIIQHPELGNTFPLLVEAAKRLGSVQIRNVATIGGNLSNCSPCADTATPLLVMEAKVKLQNPETTREMPVVDFFQGPGASCLITDEIMTQITIDPPSENAQAVFLKKGRVKMDLAVASVAILLELEGDKCLKARIAAGSVAPVPLRLRKVEELLEGKAIQTDLIAEAQRLAEESVSPITDIRSTEEYRRKIVGVYVKRGLEKLSRGIRE